MNETHRDGINRRQLLTYGAGSMALGGSPLMHAYLGAAEPVSQLVEAVDYPGGYGRDPKLVDPVRPAWPSTLPEPQRKLLAALADIVLVPDGEHPKPSAAGVPAFLDEWLSAPYPQQKADRVLIEPLLARLASLAAAALAVEAERLHGAKDPAMRKLTALVAGGYVSTRAGQKAIGFIGDEPRDTFEGPPPATLAEIERRAAAL